MASTEMIEILHLREYIHQHTSLLHTLANNFQTKLEKKTHGDSLLLSLSKSFQELQTVILQMKKDAEQFIRNPFEKLPPEILLNILSYLPSFRDIHKAMIISKHFNEFIKQNIHTLYKGLCLNWWETNNEIPTILKYLHLEPNVHPFVYMQEKAHQWDSRYSWKWIGKCLERIEPFGWQLKFSEETSSLFLGELVDDTLVGVGLEISANGYGAGWVRGGSFIEYKLYGEGFSYFTNKRSYKGQFKKGQLHGRGCFMYSNGISVSGQIRHSAWNGKATVTWPDGYSIRTEWKDEEPIEQYRSEVMHPTLKNKIEHGLCTAAGEKEQTAQAQPCFYCHDCALHFCVSCWNRCHQSSGHTVTSTWYTDMWCQCKESACKTTGGPKKQKM